MGSGPMSTTLAPPDGDPPAEPRVKSQTLPPDPATSPYGPAAASASASVGKFSTRQKSGLAGNCETFFSVSALVTSACCAVAVADNRNNPVHKAATTSMRRDFMTTPHPWLVAKSSTPGAVLPIPTRDCC